MAKQSEDRTIGGLSDVLEELPTDQLKEQTKDFAAALGERALAVASDKVGGLTDRLANYAENGGSHGGGLPWKQILGVGAAGVKQLVSNQFGGGSGGGKGGGGGRKTKATNIVEQIEVGVPVRVAYNQWTEFQDFPKFTKKVEQVEQQDDQKLTWKAGIFLSHRTWESTIVEQVPDELIVWRSKGDKGYVNGAVTFHEIAPNLTKILLVLEYHPQGLFERTGNLWRAQGRRARLELKHFGRHVMTQTILDQEGVEGWRGEIRDGDVVRSHEEALEDEDGGQEPEDETDEQDGDDEERAENQDEEEGQDEGEDEGAEEERPDDEYEDEDEEEPEGEEEPEDEYEPEPEDEYEPEDEDEYDEPEDEYEDEPDEEPEYEDEEEPEDEADADSGDEYDDDRDDDRHDREPARSRRRRPAMSR